MIDSSCQKILDKIPTGFMILDQLYNVIFLNNALTSKLKRKSPDQSPVSTFFNEYDQYNNFKLFIKTIDENVPAETETTFKNMDDQPFSVLLTIRKYGESHLLVCVQDISGQKAYERVIGQSFDNFVKTTTDLDEAMKKIKQQHQVLQDYKKTMIRELKIAEKVQNTLIPSKKLITPSCSIFGLSCPSAQVGGDFFDYFKINDDLCAVFLADVSGHGVPSALITAMLKALFAEAVARTLDSGKILTYINQIIARSLEGSGFFLTALCMIINTKSRSVSMANAGHEYPLKFDDTSVSELGKDSGQTIIGSFQDIEYKEIAFPIEKGNMIALFTDGITEARNAEGEFFQKEKLIDIVKKKSTGTLESLASHIMQVTRDYSLPAPPADDRSIIFVKIE